MIEWAVPAALAVGLLFNALAVIGLHRFPDVYTRLHAATKCTTFGSIFIVLAAALYSGSEWYHGRPHNAVLVIHSVIALAAILLTNPTGAHAIARAAYKSGHEPIASEDALEGVGL
ncbi:MAG: monovalent cation/H(+) antiporter subunit G [Candidatus Diapherotrites archaeon]|nr:monovalent cation/H(+) antiporter subunit G [Candidatus Diapherotrites archaeon]